MRRYREPQQGSPHHSRLAALETILEASGSNPLDDHGTAVEWLARLGEEMLYLGADEITSAESLTTVLRQAGIVSPFALREVLRITHIVGEHFGLSALSGTAIAPGDIWAFDRVIGRVCTCYLPLEDRTPWDHVGRPET